MKKSDMNFEDVFRERFEGAEIKPPDSILEALEQSVFGVEPDIEAPESDAPGFEDAFRNAFEGAELTPPAGLWDAIAGKPDTAPAPSFEKSIRNVFRNAAITPPAAVWSEIVRYLDKPKRRPAGYLWLRIGGLAAALLFLVLFFGNEYLTFDNTNKNGNSSAVSIEKVQENAEGNNVQNNTFDNRTDGTNRTPGNSDIASAKGNTVNENPVNSENDFSDHKHKENHTISRAVDGTSKKETDSNSDRDLAITETGNNNTLVRKSNSSKNTAKNTTVIEGSEIEGSESRSGIPVILTERHETVGPPEMKFAELIPVFYSEETKATASAESLAGKFEGNDFSLADTETSTDEPKENTERKKIGIMLGLAASSGSFSPNFSVDQSLTTLSIIGADSSALGNDLAQNITGTYREFGLELSVPVGKKWMLTSGAYLRKSSFSTDFTAYEFETSSDTISLPTDAIIPIQGNMQADFTTLTVPLLAEYRLGNGKVTGMLSGGAAFDVLLNHTYSSNIERFEVNMGEHQSLTGNLVLAAGLNYRIWKFMEINAGADYRSNFGSLINEEGTKFSPEHIGFRTKLRFRF